jgi:hypothetical protein
MFRSRDKAILTISLSLLALTPAAPLATVAAAQEASTAPPPELRDFRLDPKPAEKPAEAPVGPPSDTPPPSKATQPPTPPPAPTPAPREEKPRAEQPRPTSAPEKKQAAEPVKKEAEKAEADEAKPAEIEQAEPTQPLTPSSEPSTTEEAAPPTTNVEAPPAPQSFTPNLWTALAALGLLALLLAAGLFWFRRKKVAAIDDDGELAFEEAAPVPTEEIVLAAEPVAAPEPVLTSGLQADFTPQQAQLSLANLTISGKLSLRNTGTAPLRDLKVRTTMISASENQRSLIQQFHESESYGHAEPIGDARAGEEIALSLEIQQPRVELSEFDWRERRFMAPIVLIHLSGRGPKGLEHCELSCLIGRETAPEAERMKPFHTDRGPRRFDGLGVRLVRI